MSRAALLVVVLVSSCATGRDPSVASLERRVRELEDQVYGLERSREELERRLAAIDTGAGAEPSEDYPTSGAVSSTPVRAVADDRSAGARTSSEQLWAAARREHEAGRYSEAIPLLRDYLRRHPNDARAVDAQYYLGEAYYGESNFAQAVVELDRLVADHPTDPRAPEALYKTGLSYLELGYERNARQHLQRLERDYPESRAAAAAAPLLRRLAR